MKKTLAGLALVVIALAAYLALWPVPVEPAGWPAPPAPGYTGPHAANQRLAGLRHIDLKGEAGPEHVAVGPNGKLYTAVDGGKILRMNPDGSGQEVFARTGGRVLGFDFDAAGQLIGADAFRGLVSIAVDGMVTVLTDQVDDDPIRFADAVAVARNGRIYFTDASTRFGAREGGGIMEASMLELIEQSASGRVLEYDPATKKTRVIARGFSFANGIALSRDEQALFMAETGRFRIWMVSLQGNTPARVLLDNLPCTCRERCGRCPRTMGTSSRSPRTARWWPTCRIARAPTRRPRPSRKRRTGCTSRACTGRRSPGCRSRRTRPVS